MQTKKPMPMAPMAMPVADRKPHMPTQLPSRHHSTAHEPIKPAKRDRDGDSDC